MCPSCTRDTDGIAAKLLRCGIASEALQRNMPLSWVYRGGSGLIQKSLVAHKILVRKIWFPPPPQKKAQNEEKMPSTTTSKKLKLAHILDQSNEGDISLPEDKKLQQAYETHIRLMGRPPSADEEATAEQSAILSHVCNHHGVKRRTLSKNKHTPTHASRMQHHRRPIADSVPGKLWVEA